MEQNRRGVELRVTLSYSTSRDGPRVAARALTATAQVTCPRASRCPARMSRRHSGRNCFAASALQTFAQPCRCGAVRPRHSSSGMRGPEQGVAELEEHDEEVAGLLQGHWINGMNTWTYGVELMCKCDVAILPCSSCTI